MTAAATTTTISATASTQPTAIMEERNTKEDRSGASSSSMSPPVPAPPVPAKEPNTTVSMMTEEEDYPDEPETLQEELNEVLEAFYECVSEEDIQAYQRLVEDIEGEKIAEHALAEPELAPSFALEDQDGDPVVLQDLLEKGPVVLVFYRGKWCPHCNATLMRYQNKLVPALKQFNATLVAISPMMPDGTLALATKRDLEFSVCSDSNNTLAKAFRLAFTVQPHSRPFMVQWGEDVPKYNGIDSWEIPLPATYVIAQDGRLAWSFVDNDPGIRAEPTDILQEVAAIAARRGAEDNALSSNGSSSNHSNSPTIIQTGKKRKKLFNRRISSTFKKIWKGGEEEAVPPPSEDVEEEEEYPCAQDSGQFSIRSSDSHSSTQHKKKKKRTKTKPLTKKCAKELLGKYLLAA